MKTRLFAPLVLVLLLMAASCSSPASHPPPGDAGDAAAGQDRSEARDVATPDGPAADNVDRDGADATQDMGQDMGSMGQDMGFDTASAAKLKPNGAACAANGDCDSKFCVSQVCCNEACDGLCQACSIARTKSLPDGTCGPVAVGGDELQARCASSTGAPCGNTGKCDGSGACQKAGSTVICKAAACADFKFSPAAVCDGQGACSAPVSIECRGALCIPNKGCVVACAGDNDCPGGYCAAAKTCSVKKVDGMACDGDGECLNAHCVSGFCCNTACTATCMSCAMSTNGSMNGACLPVTAGGSSGGKCTKDAATCGRDGTCDGNGGCRFAVPSTACVAPACNAGSLTPAANCNGTGTCASMPAAPCPGHFGCASATACKTTCASLLDCSLGYYCAAGQCKPQEENGTACGDTTACSSGFCVAGLCCDKVCNGTCMSCAAAETGGADGTCQPIAANGSSKGACKVTSACGHTGVCDGAGKCQYRAGGTPCAAAKCVDSTFTAEAICDGAGTCGAVTSAPCPGHVVCASANACKVTTCTAEGDCGTGYYCNTGVCHAKVGLGAACAGASACAAGTCVGGFCCESACTEKCFACKASQTGFSDGLCKPIAPGGSSNGACVAGGACGLNGKCDGTGNCQYVPTGTSCGGASCSAGQLTPASSCNGGGACVTPRANMCPNDVLCASAMACKGPCAGDGDCPSGAYCAAPSCLPKKSTGGSCTLGNECVSGTCRDNVCCGGACSLSCQSCAFALTGTANGTCAARLDSPMQVCDNACVNLNSDGNNCGACGRSCQGAGCAGGQCQVQTLATADGLLSGLAVSSSKVFTFDYFRSPSFGTPLPLTMNAYAVPKTGGSLSPISTFRITTYYFSAGVDYAAATDDLLIWQVNFQSFGRNADLNSCDPKSCDSTFKSWFKDYGTRGVGCDLEASPVKCFAQDYDWTNMVYTTGDAPQSFDPPLDLPRIATTVYSNRFTIANGVLYGAGDAIYDADLPTAVVKVPTSGGPVSTITTSPNTGGLFLWGPVFVTSRRIFFLGGDLSPSGTSIYYVPSDVSGASPVFYASMAPEQVNGFKSAYHADDSGVYWFDTDHRLVTCPVAGCSGPPRVLATNTISDFLTRDGSALYWLHTSDSKTAVLKVVP